MITEKILQIADAFKGITEKPSNSGFYDNLVLDEWLKKEFPGWSLTTEDMFKTAGWSLGESWCAYTAELIWKLAYSHFDSTIVHQLDKLFSAGAVQTYTNFLQSDFKTSNIPQIGSIVVYQTYKDGKAQWSGHVGVVREIQPGNVFVAIEGNTSADGSREGTTVAAKTRKLDYTFKNGLRVKGFVLVKEIEDTDIQIA